MKNAIIDKYEIIEQIGHGGMSKVYKVRDIRLQKYWALKEINLEEELENKDILEQSIISEMELLKDLEHPTLPRIVDYFNEKTKIYIIIDYIEGETLKERVRREGPQKEETVIEWALQLCDVIDYLHSKNIIYRDLKPSNIMINTYGKLKLIDFGTARIYKENNSEDTVYFGTRGYAAPEQFGRQGQTDKRTDVYSMGATLYYLLTGKSPMYTIDGERVQTYSEKMKRLIERCMQIDPINRYRSFEEVRKELLECKKNDESLKREEKDFENTVILNQGVEDLWKKGSIKTSLECDLQETVYLEENQQKMVSHVADAVENIDTAEQTVLKKSNEQIVILVGILAGVIIAIVVFVNIMTKEKIELQSSGQIIEKSLMSTENILVQETTTAELMIVPTEKVTVKSRKTKSPKKTKKPEVTKTPVVPIPDPIKTKGPARTLQPNNQQEKNDMEKTKEDMEILDDDIVVEVIE